MTMFERLLPVCLFLVIDAGVGYGQGYRPEQAAAKMAVPAGFSVNLFASEPMVRQPVCIEFDARGRVWVIQYLQYPNPAGLKRVAVDRYSRTQYDRIPQPPPHGPVGADRITILDDTDGDGVADSARDFVSGLNLASGLAFGHGGVYVLNVPYLLFYPDENCDDVPDSDPTVLLTGFGMEDAHSVANSLAWGPDGWLYGCQGSTVTANIRGIEFQQGVWRYHPSRDEFELFCEGGGNSWGLDFDSEGQLLYGTNWGGKVMLHGVQGAYLIKSFGKHGPLHNRFAYGYFDHVPYTDFRGGHVSVGGLFYTGTSFPEEFRGKYIAGDLLGHAVYWHELSRNGTTYTSRYAGTLLEGNDTWFAPTDVLQGPQGSIYIADWHDQRTAHPDPDADWDRSNGRVVRIQAEAARRSPIPDFQQQSTIKLIEQMLQSANGWHVRQCRQELSRRQDRTSIPILSQSAVQTDEPRTALRALWGLAVCDGLNEKTALQLLDHPTPAVREWTVRLLGDRRSITPAIGYLFNEMATHDDAARVRAQLASTAKRLPFVDALPILRRLISRDLDQGDPYIPLLIWWAVEQHALTQPGSLLDVFATPAIWRTKLFREFVSPRLMRRFAAEGNAAGLAAAERLLRSSPDSELHAKLITACAEGLQQTSADRDLAGLAESARLLTAIKTSSADSLTKIRIAIRLGDPRSLQTALRTATDSKMPDSQRLAMLNLLDELGQSDCIEPMLGLLVPTSSDSIQIAALNVLGQSADPSIADKLLDTYDDMSPDVRAQARRILWGRKNWALRFLKQIEPHNTLIREIVLTELSQVALHDDEQLNELMLKFWGNISASTPGEKLAEMRRLNNDLRAATGDLESGRTLFVQHCANCHQFHGEGKKIGPELTHANRSDRDFLLSSLVDPSGQIRREYLAYVVVTVDGRVLNGLMADQTPDTITLVDAKDHRVTVARAEIDELRPATASLMPENLYKQFTPQQLRDLFAYLQN